MRRLMSMLVMSLLTACALILPGCSSREEFHYQEDNETPLDELVSEADDEESRLAGVELNGEVTCDFAYCEIKRAQEYFAQNEFISVFDVRFKYSKIVLTVQMGNLAKTVKRVRLSFEREGTSSCCADICNVEPWQSYLVTIPRDGVNKFALKRCLVVDGRKAACGPLREFGKELEISGPNTIICKESGTYQFFDKNHRAIDYCALEKGEHVPIMFGAVYFRKEQMG